MTSGAGGHAVVVVGKVGDGVEGDAHFVAEEPQYVGRVVDVGAQVGVVLVSCAQVLEVGESLVARIFDTQPRFEVVLADPHDAVGVGSASA